MIWRDHIFRRLAVKKSSVDSLLQFVFHLATSVIVDNLHSTVLITFSSIFHRFIRWNMPPHQVVLVKLNCHLLLLLLTNDWVSLDINCEPLSLIINVSTHLDAKNLFNRQTHDGDEKPGTKSRYMRLLKVQVNKAIQQLNVCNLP